MVDWRGLLDDLTATTRDTFGEPTPCQYMQRRTGVTKPVTAIFDYQYIGLEAGGSVPTTSRVPVLDVRNADLGVKPASEDEVEIEGHGRFRVIETHPDSSGNTKLHLRKI